MNILIVDNSVAFTGAFKCALNEADILSDLHRFIFVLPENSKVLPLLQEKGYVVYTLPLREISKSAKAILTYPIFLIKNLITLKGILQKEHIDVLQVNDFYNMLGVCSISSGYKGKLLSYVRFMPSAMPYFLKNFWIKLAHKYSHKVIAVSDAVLAQLPSNYKNVRIYDPIQLSEQYKSVHRQNKKEVLFLYPANFTRGKGQEYAIEAFYIALSHQNNLRLRFIGGDMGLKKNAKFRDELVNKVKTLNLSGFVSFEGFATNIEKEIKDADVVLNFSDSESFSMTCLEAAFYGTALIATRCGGPEEIIKDRESGILLPCKDINAMSDAMLELANNEQLRANYAMVGKQYVTEKFSVEKFRRHFFEII